MDTASHASVRVGAVRGLLAVLVSAQSEAIARSALHALELGLECGARAAEWKTKARIARDVLGGWPDDGMHTTTYATSFTPQP